MAQVAKVNTPSGTPDWFQAIADDLTKTLQRLQQQIDTQASQLAMLEARVTALE